MITRPGLARHAYAAAPQPGWVTQDAVCASVPGLRGGQSLMPLSQPLAMFAADGAPFCNTGYQPAGAVVQVPGGQARFTLPPRAAQIDLADTTSWDRPVFWPGSR